MRDDIAETHQYQQSNAFITQCLGLTETTMRLSETCDRLYELTRNVDTHKHLDRNNLARINARAIALDQLRRLRLPGLVVKASDELLVLVRREIDRLEYLLSTDAP